MSDWSNPLAVWDGRPSDEAFDPPIPAGYDGRDGSIEEEIPPCPQLLEELDRFFEDPMTEASGEGGDLSRLVFRGHVKRHNCQGYGG